MSRNAGLWICIHFMRIRIRDPSVFLNADPDPAVFLNSDPDPGPA